MKARLMALGAALALLVGTSQAHAQQASTAPLPPPLSPVVIAPAPADPRAASADAVTLPLRMSFLTAGGGFMPVTGGGSGCSEPSVDAAGTILPVQPHMEVQVTMRLTLVAFSNLGCPGDPYAAFTTGVGAGATYAAPLRPNLFLVGSAGSYGGGRRPPAQAAAVDLVWKTPERSTSLGAVVKAPPGRGVQVVGRVGGSF
jgi:hypothetical protein